MQNAGSNVTMCLKCHLRTRALAPLEPRCFMHNGQNPVGTIGVRYIAHCVRRGRSVRFAYVIDAQSLALFSPESPAALSTSSTLERPSLAKRATSLSLRSSLLRHSHSMTGSHNGTCFAFCRRTSGLPFLASLAITFGRTTSTASWGRPIPSRHGASMM
jgi:hypothetical protein